MVVDGGEVIAIGGDYGAGIGGGCNATGAYVTINGGTVNAIGGKDAAGIGGGEDGPGNAITILNDYQHSHGCVNCAYTLVENHDFGDTSNPHDCICGKKFNAVTDVYKVVCHYASTDCKTYDAATDNTGQVVRGKEYALPAPPAVKGLRFMGYILVDKAPEGLEMLNSEAVKTIEAGTVITPTTDLHYYARYRYVYDAEWAWSDDHTSATVTISHEPTGQNEKHYATVVENPIKEPTPTDLGERSWTALFLYQKAPDILYTFGNTCNEELYYSAEVILDALDVDNEDIIEEYDDCEASVTINNLTLRKDGKLHALCLPFSTMIAGSPLEGATIYAVADERIVGSQLQMNFKPVAEDYIEAGEPYFVKWASGTDVENPEFDSAYLKEGLAPAQSQYYEFSGTYDMLAVDEETKGMVYTLEDGQLEQVKDDLIDAFSNYFYISRDKADDGSIAI